MQLDRYKPISESDPIIYGVILVHTLTVPTCCLSISSGFQIILIPKYIYTIEMCCCSIEYCLLVPFYSTGTVSLESVVDMVAVQCACSGFFGIQNSRYERCNC